VSRHNLIDSYAETRSLANWHASQRKKYFEGAAQAIKMGDGRSANSLSAQGKHRCSDGQ
jgi:hypothetical protein